MQFQKYKKHHLHFQKWQKINFCTRKKFKTTKNAIFGLKKQDFWYFKLFWNGKKCVFALLKLQFFSNFRALWNISIQQVSYMIYVYFIRYFTIMETSRKVWPVVWSNIFILKPIPGIWLTQTRKKYCNSASKYIICLGLDGVL